MGSDLPQSRTPELIIGLVAPIGVELGAVADVIEATLEDVRYSTKTIKLTELMLDIDVAEKPASSEYIQSYTEKIDYANAIRARLGEAGMVALAVSSIRSFRSGEHERIRSERSLPEPEDGLTDEERPLQSQAYILRQLKHPDEVRLLRSIYGRQFILVSAYTPESMRLKRIEDKQRLSLRGVYDEGRVRADAFNLVRRDRKEQHVGHGQNVGDAFPLGDVFIDASTSASSELGTRRFINLLFGDNQLTPTHDEYGMYVAKSASLRSSDLSRQVGAAIFRRSGEVLTLGCNEVPKAGGGTYWTGDEADNRDFVQGYDPNERFKTEVLVDLIDRLRQNGLLSEELQSSDNLNSVMDKLLSNQLPRPIKDAKVMDLIEFGRIVHAEMSAITDASRKGISLQGSTLYCTTFPCHLCAKHIVAAGVIRVVYIEPYPKSYASELHSDSIAVDGERSLDKVTFEAFLGVSPVRYRDLFEKGKRKRSGVAERWDRGSAHPMIEVYYPSYYKAEAHVVKDARARMEVREELPALADEELDGKAV